MTNAYQLSVDLGMTGSNAEKVAALRAMGLTVRPIVLAELLFLLNFRGMLTKLVSNNSDEKWAGTVLTMKAEIAGDSVATAHVDRWLSHITNPRNTHWDTTNAAYSAPFWAMAQAVAGRPGMPSAEDFAAVAAIGGGWLFADLTVEQFSDSRTEYEQEQSIAAAAEEARAAYEAIRVRRQSWDTLSAQIRSQIESGLADNAAIIAAVTTGLGG